MTLKVTEEAKLAVQYSTYRPADAFNKIHITKSSSWYQILHVSAPKCHLHGVC